ncbi:MAG: adenylate/guanylate cyclase domain-containing protein, partial [Acidimicrobiia bacterium]
TMVEWSRTSVTGHSSRSGPTLPPSASPSKSKTNAATDPLHEDGDIHGTVVAQASRIGDLGDAGEVIVSDSVRQLAAGKGFTFEPKGEVSLKGFDDPE